MTWSRPVVCSMAWRAWFNLGRARRSARPREGREHGDDDAADSRSVPGVVGRGGASEDARARRPSPQDRELLHQDRAAARVSAYLYGDVLVLAALVALHPHDLTSTKGLAYVLGTAVSTYVAHVLVNAVGLSIRGGGPSGPRRCGTSCVMPFRSLRPPSPRLCS